MLINTIHGLKDAADLARTLGFEDRPDKLAIWVEWRLEGELVRRDAFPLFKNCEDPVSTAIGPVPRAHLARTIELTDSPTDIAVAVVWRLDGVLVKRDANVIVKEISVEASAVAAALG
jgi:hypothetical protein